MMACGIRVGSRPTTTNFIRCEQKAHAGDRVRLWLVAVVIAVLAGGVPVGSLLADSVVPVPVRVGSHEGYGRVVFDLPKHTEYQVTQQGQHVVVQFIGGVTIGAAAGVPHNVLGVTGGEGQAELVVAPGTVLRDWRMGNHVVIDVWDQGAAPVIRPAAAEASQARGTSGAGQAAAPAVKGATGPGPPAAKPPPVVASPAVAPAAAVLPPPSAPPSPVALPTHNSTSDPATSSLKSSPPSVQPEDTPVPPAHPPVAVSPSAVGSAPSVAQASDQAQATPVAQVAPNAAVADVTVQPAALPASVLTVPFDSPVGVAAFRRGNAAIVVFDQRNPIDTAALHDDPVFGTATVQLLPAATVMRIRLDAGVALALSRTANVWRIATVAAAPMLRPIPASVSDNRLVLSAAAPGSVVTIADPDTGTTLLVGTQLHEGQGMPARRRSSEFTVLPTWQGVAVEAIGDMMTMRQVQDGFVLAGGPEGLAVSPPADVADLLAHTDGLTRQFDFPNLPSTALMQRLRRQVTDDATTPPLGRGPKRQALARTMISLGLGVEAQGVLQLAVADDPHEATSPDDAALAAIAALVAHRPDDATGLSDPQVVGADDIALWRAVRRAEMQADPAPTAAIFSATLPLLLGYPAEMRDRVLPLVAETLVAGGEIATATALLNARKDDATLDLARGMLQEARGDGAGALAIYNRLAQSRDQSVHARAAMRAVELQLAGGGIDAKQAAERMDALLYAWRGDAQERTLREHLAGLRARIGEWRSALTLLRETGDVFPEDKAAIHAELTDMFTALLRGDAEDGLAPLELVALVDENADLLPGGVDGEALQAKLADRLVALDLPNRAGPVLDKLMRAAPTAVGRAGFGTRLAALRLREDDATGAVAALTASAGTDLPAELTERRTLLLADANARHGDSDAALAALGTLNTASADEARATILERANDWPAAEKALTDYAGKSVPADGKLDDGQRRTLLRLATAAARAGDDATLAGLRLRDTARMAAGPLADMFRLLTADQVRSVTDLKRSGQEAKLAGGLSGQLKALQPAVRPTP
jgi:hypothetical protein